MAFLGNTVEPLAQTFNVSEESGVFITKVGLFFSSSIDYSSRHD